MKKIMSLILSLALIFSVFNLGLTSFAVEDYSNIQSFIDESRKLLLYEPEPVFYTASADGNFDNDIDFSSCRLILKSDKKPEKLNSVGIADGFKDYYIIQFKNELDAKEAYEYYSDKDYVSNIAVDEDVGVLTSVTPYSALEDANSLDDFNDFYDDEEEIPVYDGVPDRLNSWGAEVTGTYAVKDYLTNHNRANRKVVVGVLDSGIMFDHEYFSNKQERLEKTNFTITDDSNSEYDIIRGHGTAVTSVILDCTPDNVIVRNYKIINEKGHVNITAFASAVLQTISDDVDIINCSFSLNISNKDASYELVEDLYNDVFDNGIVTVCSAGNYINESFGASFYTLPSMLDCVISVTGLSEDLSPTFSVGKCVDVSAPGDDIPCAYLDLYAYEDGTSLDTYAYLDGTSFSSPLTASICAQILTVYPNYTPDIILDILKETATPYDERVNLKGIDDLYGLGFVDAVGAVGLQRPAVSASLSSGRYEGEISIEFVSDSNEDIYYSLDCSYPTPQTGRLYTSPIKLYSDEALVNAVAYDKNGVPSKVESHLYRSTVLADESDFEINENGIITKYNGTLLDIIIPETINGIEVKNIDMFAFKDTGITGISLPDTIKTLGNCYPGDKTYPRSSGSFRGNTTLAFIDGEGLEEISYYVFQGCKVLQFIDFPNVKLIREYAFGEIGNTVSQLKLPKLEEVTANGFTGLHCIYLYLPELKTCGYATFEDARIYEIYFPKFKYSEEGDDFYLLFSFAQIGKPIDLSEIEHFDVTTFAAFGSHATQFIKRVEFSKLISLHDLPGEYSTVVLPSTVQIMPNDLVASWYETGPFGPAKNNIKLYGSSGTYVEKWAKEKGFPFIEITQETAVATDLPRYYKPYMGKLEADVIGFNREYQWYANDVNSNEGGTPIEGANDKFFDPATYPNAKYYYCEVTSTDIGYEPIIIKTSACENRMFEKNVTDISKNTERNGYAVTVKGSPDKIQFVSSNGSTRTYNRDNLFVIVTAFDANNNSTTDKVSTAYEIWNIAVNFPVDNYTVIAKYGKAWDIAGYDFNPKDKEDCRFISAEATGEKGEKTITVKTGVDVIKIQLSEPERNYCATINYGYVDENGIRTWTFTRAFVLGSHDMDILIKTKDGWTDGGKVQFESVR